jgi:hypothetical protein
MSYLRIWWRGRRPIVARPSPRRTGSVLARTAGMNLRYAVVPLPAATGPKAARLVVVSAPIPPTGRAPAPEPPTGAGLPLDSWVTVVVLVWGVPAPMLAFTVVWLLFVAGPLVTADCVVWPCDSTSPVVLVWLLSVVARTCVWLDRSVVRWVLDEIFEAEPLPVESMLAAPAMAGTLPTVSPTVMIGNRSNFFIAASPSKVKLVNVR